MSNFSEEKQKLIEEMGLYFEKNVQIPPLAARIYAIMILSPEAGHTFEEIMELVCASKSSVSTNLHLLLQLKNIEYFTKTGDRKRYFRSSRDYLHIMLQEYLTNVQGQLRLVEKINEFNSKNNPIKYENGKYIGKLFLDYLKLQEQNLINTNKKIVELFNKEP